MGKESQISNEYLFNNCIIIKSKRKRINIDFPTWMVQKLDNEARHIGVSRQAIIKTWLADKLMEIEKNKVAS